MKTKKEIVLDSDYVVISINDGILKIRYKNSKEISLRIAQEIYLDRLRVSNGISWPVLCDFRNMENMTEEAKEFYSQDYTYRGITATAFLFKSPIQILIYNFYLAFYTPPIPFKAFACEKKAKAWLETFKLERLN